MSITPINKYDVGYRTYGDTEDSNKFERFDNLEIDKTGMTYKRDPQKKVIASGITFLQVAHWVNENLPEGEIWFIVGEVDNGAAEEDRLMTYLPSTWGWIENLENTWNATGGHTQIITTINDVRFANGLSRDVSIYNYNKDDKFFYGGWTASDEVPSELGFNYGNAHINRPASWTHSSLTGLGVGSAPLGHYHYKVVGLYDGVQEMELPADDIHLEVTSSGGSAIQFVFTLATSDFNPRIKALKIYRGFAIDNIDVTYKHIVTVKLNNTSSDETIVNITSTVGQDLSDKIILIDDGVDFTAYDPNPGTPIWYGVDFLDTDGNERSLQIVDGSTANGYCLLEEWDGTPISDKDRLWLGDYIIRWGASGGGSGISLERSGTGIIGDNVLYKNGAGWKDNLYSNSIAKVGARYVSIIGNTDEVLRLSRGHLASGAGIAINVYTSGVYMSTSAGTVTIRFVDNGLPDLTSHPFDGVTKTKANFKYGFLHAGRMIGLGTRLDPDDAAEDHENGIVFSEFKQYDNIPISNFLIAKDAKGGKLTGGVSNGTLATIFTETGIFGFDVPTVDSAGWSLQLQEPSIGCIAPDSIVAVESMIFFMSSVGVHVVLPDFTVLDLTSMDIKSDYTSASNKASGRITYDVYKQRLLCRFGDTSNAIYCFNLVPWMQDRQQAPVWTKMAIPARATNENFWSYLTAVDENKQVYSFDNYDQVRPPSAQVNYLYNQSGGAESMAPHLVTPWMKLNKIDSKLILRRLALQIQSAADDVTVKVYVNRETTAVKTFTFDASVEADDIVNKIWRVSYRAFSAKLEIYTAASTTTDFELYRIELEQDDA